MTDSAIIECGLVFLENLTEQQYDNLTFSKDTKKQLESYRLNKIHIVSTDIYINCMNNGLGPQKSMSLAKRFNNLKFADLYYVSETDLLKCPNIGQKTVSVVKELTKPIVTKTIVKVNSDRLDLMTTLLPTKVVNELGKVGIKYADELRCSHLYEDFNLCFKNIISSFYDSYIQFNDKLRATDYIREVFDAALLKYRNSLNNFCRHNYKLGDPNLPIARYFCVSYLNELITRIGFDTQGLFGYYTGDTNKCIQKMNNEFRHLQGTQNYVVSKELLDETMQVMDLLYKHIAVNTM